MPRPALGRDEAQHDDLARRDEAQRREVARTRVIAFEEAAVDVELVEKHVREFDPIESVRDPGA